MLGGVTNEPAHVLLVARSRDPNRHHLKDTGVRTVKSAGQLVEQELPFEETAQVFPYSNASGVIQGVLSPLLLATPLNLFTALSFLAIPFTNTEIEGAMFGK